MAAHYSTISPRPYGYTELKLLYTRNLTVGINIGTVLILLFVTVSYVMRQFRPPDAPIGDTITVEIKDVLPPPLVPKAPPGTATHKGTKIENPVPVPVPDNQVNPEQTIPDQNTLSQIQGIEGGTDNGTQIVVSTAVDAGIETEPEPSKWQKIEIYPVIIRTVKPVYPEVAIRLNIQGRVVVNVLVDKEGKVKRAFIMKSDDDILNQAALDAAKAYYFSPGIMNNGPVMVWVTIPFDFKLR